MKIVAFIKNWTLPLAMVAGVLIYLAFAHIDLLAPTKPMVHRIDAVLTPSLIFIQLLLTFCRVDLRDIRPKKWHFILLAIQVVGGAVGYFLLLPVNEVLAQGALVCFICPTATAAAVITSKLGGSAATIISYTVLINITVAILVPLAFPLVYEQANMSFLAAFLTILSKIFPLLILPLVVAIILKYCVPSAYGWLRDHSSMAFYVWAVALALVMGKTAKSIVDDEGHFMQIVWLALVSLVICALQFFFGKRIGGQNGERISGGQALGQKNTVFGIWLAYTYLNPITSVSMGAYVLWQNTINSWQLWKQRHAASKSTPQQA